MAKRAGLDARWAGLFERNWPEVEEQLTAALVEIRQRGETPVVPRLLAGEIRNRFTGDPKLLRGWTVPPKASLGDYEFSDGEIGFVLHFAWLSAQDWWPKPWQSIDDPSARFLVFSFGIGGGGFRDLFRHERTIRGDFDFFVVIPPAARPIPAPPDIDVRHDVVERWLDPRLAPPTDECVECGRPAASHYGDGGYDCLIRSAEWLFGTGIVVPGKSMERALGQAWPEHLRSEMVTSVRTNSSKYGKYSPQRRRIYRTFLTGVPARELVDGLLKAGGGHDRASFEDLIAHCRRFVDTSPGPPPLAFERFLELRQNIES